MPDRSPNPEVSTRLADLNEFVKTSEDRIAKIQRALNSSSLESSAYAMLVDALRNEAQLQVEQLSRLNEQINAYRIENKGLQEMMKLRENEVSEATEQATVKEKELVFLEARIQAMIESLTVIEADAFYARAQALEEAAARTRLAPHKKRETYREALELYKKALSMGKRGATSDIRRLQKKLY